MTAAEIRIQAQKELSHWESTLAKHSAVVQNHKLASEVLEVEFAVRYLLL